MEEHSLQIRDTTDDHIRQWTIIRQPRLQRFLLRIGNQEPILVSKTFAGQWTKGSDEPTLLKIIKVWLEEVKGTWLEELPHVLWAYKTTARISTGETPFGLTYGTKAVILVEVGVISMRKEAFSEDSNDNQLRVNLHCLDEIRDGASQKITKYQQKMAEYYNKRVKLRRLNIGDLVLCKVTLATKDPTQGKLGPAQEGPYKVIHYSRQGNYHLETMDGKKLPRPWNIEHLKKYHQQM